MDASDTPTPYLTPSGAGERIWLVGNTITLKSTAESTGGAMMFSEIEAPPGTGPPPHLHEHADEWFYVLDGTFEILLGDELVHAGAGDFAFVPRGTVHRFANIGDASARILAALSPAGIERFFRAVGTPATGDGTAPVLSPLETPDYAEAAAENDMRVVAWKDEDVR